MNINNIILIMHNYDKSVSWWIGASIGHTEWHMVRISSGIRAHVHLHSCPHSHTEVHIIWAVHQAHHSNEDFTALAALRQAFLQPLTAWVGLVIMMCESV